MICVPAARAGYCSLALLRTAPGAGAAAAHALPASGPSRLAGVLGGAALGAVASSAPPATRLPGTRRSSCILAHVAAEDADHLAKIARLAGPGQRHQAFPRHEQSDRAQKE